MASSNPAPDLLDDQEKQRLSALEQYHILDTAPEAEFDDIVRIAAEICVVPMALISLVDDKRQWFKAAVGLEATETAREIAFCARAIEQDGVFVVPDAARDSRFSSNPLVTGAPHLRFYAGAPLQTPDGHAIGTLCVLDQKPRVLSPQQQLALAALGRQVMAQLELRRALMRQRSDEERNQLILDSAVDYAIISIDLNGLVTSWNEGARRIFGWTAAEMCGRRCDDFFTPEDRTAGVPEREMGAALTRGRGSDERWHLRKNGTRFFASGEMMPLTDLARKPVGFLKIVRDRTAHRRAERTQPALLELADRLRELTDPVQSAYVAAEIMGRTLQVSGAGYGTLSADGQTLTVAQAWAAPGEAAPLGSHSMSRYGRVLEELRRGTVVAMADTELDPRIDAEELKDAGVRALINFPLLEQGRLVALFFVNSSVAREWDPADIDFIREVAERTRLAVERRSAEFHFRELSASLEAEVEARLTERNRLWVSTNDLMGTVGMDGYLKEINPAWTRLLGWDAQTLLLKPFMDIVDPADHERGRHAVAQLARGEPILEHTSSLRAQDGSWRVVTWSAVPQGEVFYVVGRDISRQRDIEERLRQSQKMEAIGQLTGGIAHDFNNLLAGIMGSISLIRVRTKAGRHDLVEPLVESAERSTRKAAALTERLLAFSRRQSLDARPQDVNRLILEMEELLHRTLGEQVELQIALTEGVFPALTDANQLENAILNLAINARDAMAGGGRLTIETASATLDAHEAASNSEVVPGDYVMISVSDTGVGMTPEVAARAFDPFFTTKPIGQGTGLGLSMIYGFAKQSNGHARIESEVGRGTTVRLYLPRASEAVGAAVEGNADVVPPRGLGERVLVVEDDETVRMLVVEVLKELGYQFLEAAEPQAALRYLGSALQIDLLLTDVGLPNMNGRQLAEIARQRRPQLKVLFLTGYAEHAAVRGGFLEQGMDMLTKPFALDALATKVKGMLNPATSPAPPASPRSAGPLP